MEKRIKELIKLLNKYTKEYDNGTPSISDKQYDILYFELEKLEKETGIIFPCSPTQNIIYTVKNELNKVEHGHWMGSAAKTKDWNEFINYFGGMDVVGMLKLDGLTVSLEYEGGRLTKAETRGDGYKGEDILHNARVIKNIPNTINFNGKLVIDGEAICTYKDFEPFSNEYKNPRNFASGSIRLLDNRECEKRNLSFIAWNVVEGLDSNNVIDNFNTIKKLGFTVTPWTSSFDLDAKEFLLAEAEKLGYPIDGLIGRFTDIQYGKDLGTTAHHTKAIYAFKMYDEEVQSELTRIDFDVSRTGLLTPVAVFKPIEMDGTTIERASLHNLSVMEEVLGCYPDLHQPIYIVKKNQIIPQITRAEYKNDIPHDHIIFDVANCRCPICGTVAEISISDSGVKSLVCPNKECDGKLAQKISHYCSRDKGLDIRGLSLKTIEKLVEWEWITSISDIYELPKYRTMWIKKDGFGEKSVDNILNAIENSKECEWTTFVSALGIPLIGTRVSKELGKLFDGYKEFKEFIYDDTCSFEMFDGFGEEMNKALKNFDYAEADGIAAEVLTFRQPEESVDTGRTEAAAGLTFVITGKLSKPRNLIEADIVAAGGKVSSSVSAKTNYLVIDDVNSTTGKAKTARDKGIPMISEEELYKMI